MSIQVFSNRTGIPKSTLRFYEQKGLLKVKRRGNNRYRYYEEEQVETAKWIASLRTADISIEDIHRYMSSNTKTRHELLTKWTKELKVKRSTLDVGIKYLESSRYNKTFYLIERTSESIIWFKEEAEVGQFKDAFTRRREQLEECGFEVGDGYLTYLSGMETVQAKIGFTVIKFSSKPLPVDAFLEQMPAQSCILITFEKPIQDIKEGYEQLMQYAWQNEWYPAGSIYEWYHGDGGQDLDIVLPVFQINGEEN